MTTVEKLRKEGCKVRVRHTRYVDMRDHSIFPRGGKTSVLVTTPYGEEMTAEAICSKEDNYNRKYGVQLCLKRIFKEEN